MAFRARRMRQWTNQDVQTFYRSIELSDDAMKRQREPAVEACASQNLTGEDILECTQEDLVDAGVAEETARFILGLAQVHEDNFPETGAAGPDPFFTLEYETSVGARPKRLEVKASDSVGGLKQAIAVAENYTGTNKAVRLVRSGKALNDDTKLLRDVGLTQHCVRPFVTVLFTAKGGAAAPGTEDWVMELSKPLLAKVPILRDRAKMTDEVILRMTAEQWRMLIPNGLHRRQFLRALEERRAALVRQVEFNKKRELNVKNPMVKMTMKPDVIPYTDDSDAFIRAEMPCGHAIGPNNLFRYFYTELMEKMGTTELHCAAEKCDKEWPWHVVFAVCGLSAAEAGKYQRVIDENLLLRTTRACPHCHTRCDKPASITHRRMCCVTCKGGDFCWDCSQPWKGGGFQVCGNEGCGTVDRINEILQNCEDKQFKMYKKPYPVGPSIRLCPHGNCRTLVEHLKDCKHMDCPSCKKSFCFFCLDLRKNGKWGCDATGDWSFQCPIAPRQKISA